MVCAGIICLLSIFQGIYFITLFKAIQKEQFHGGTRVGKANQGLSIIICARNEADNLKLYLPSILNQQHPNFEVVVIDDGSTDQTETVLLEFEMVYSHLKRYYLDPSKKEQKGKKSALQLGIQKAMYEAILLTDADCTASSEFWAMEMHQALLSKDQSPALVLGFAPTRGKGILGAFSAFETHITALQYLGFAAKGKPYMGVGRNMAYTKSWIRRNPSDVWDPDLHSGDDDLLIQAFASASTTQIQVSPNTWMFSHSKTSWGQWLHQKARHLSTGKAYSNPFKLVLSFFPLLQGFSWIFILLLAISGYWSILLLSLSLRWAIWLLALSPSFRFFKFGASSLYLPLFDYFLSLYYVFVCFKLLIPSRSKW